MTAHIEAGISACRKRRAVLALAGVLVFAATAAACGDAEDTSGSSIDPEAENADSAASAIGNADNSVDSSADARCQENRDGGTVTFVTGFDFAASAGIIDVIAADAQGYFEELCIDVDIQPGFSPANGALVIEGKAQFGVAGSFAELVNNNIAGEGDLVAVLHWGRTAINAIALPEGSGIEDFSELCGHLVGIKGDLPYSLQAAVALSGADRSCFEEILLDGFDPVAHLGIGIDALPVYKSNEPYILEQNGVPFTLLDPLLFDIPASFGIVFTSQSFIDKHPRLAQDVVRALIRGQAFAAANPDKAVDSAFELIDAAGNPRYLAMEAERNRWSVESALIADLAPNGLGLGIPDLDRLKAEIEALALIGVFDFLPDWRSMVNTEIAAGVYDGTELLWR